jgi:hypothetical protein
MLTALPAVVLPASQDRPIPAMEVAMPAPRTAFGPAASAMRCLLPATLALLCAACAIAPVGTPLQSTATAEAPAVAAGDTWTYAVRDGFTGLPQPTQLYTVTRASAGRIEVTADTGGVREAQVYDGDWNWLQRRATNIAQPFGYNPSYQAFAFPLVPGRKWRERLTATEVRNGMRFPVWVDAAVLGWEKLRVPAGEFDTIRIRRFVVFDYLDYMTRGRTETIEEEWYAPAVKQAVRRESRGMYRSFIHSGIPGFVRVRDDDGGPGMIPDDWLISELVAYSVR